MSELEKYARQQLRLLRLGDAEREEVISEITNHLEMLQQEYRAKGLDESSASQRALLRFGDPQRLLKGIEQAKENSMRDRFRRLWFPALTVGFLAYTSELLIARFVARPRAIQVMGHYYVYSWSWLVVVAGIAALGTFWSREMGGSVRERLIVALAPAEIMAAVIAIVLPLDFVIEAWVDRLVPYAITHPIVLLAGILWMLHCAVPALVGASPFLFGETRHSEERAA